MKQELITWNQASFATGIDRIDRQHKVLVEYINELSAAIDNKQTDKIINNLFIKLYDYTQYHFQEEEAYFFTLNKVDCQLHGLQHKHFMEELSRIRLLKDPQLISSDLLYFLTDWLISHIQIEDRKFLKKNG